MIIMEGNFYGKNKIPSDYVLIFSVDTDYLNIDPGLVNDYIGQVVSQSLFEPLLIKDYDTGKIISGVADNYIILDNGERYVFNLKHDLKWSNGNILTAYDFEYAFQRLVSPELNSSASGLMYDIVNAQEINIGKIKNIRKLGVKAINKYTLEIKLNYPLSHFLELLTNINFAPVPRKVVEKYGHDWIKSENIVCNGPFILKKHKPQDYTLVVKNPYYVNSKMKTIKGIKFVVNRNLYGQIHDYKENDIHMTCNTYFPFDLVEDFRKYDDFFIEPICIISFIFINFESHTTFQNKKLRQALYYSIDKEYICKKLNYGVNVVNGFVPYGIKNYLHTKKNYFNPEKAREILKKVDKYDKNLKIIYVDYYPNKNILLYIVEMWKEILDITLTLESVSLDVLAKRYSEDKYDMCFSLIPINYNDPSSYLRSFVYSESFKGSKYSINKYIETLSYGMQNKNNDNRRKYFEKANEMLMSTLPAIPLFSNNSIYLVKPFIKNLKIFPSGQFSFSFMDIKSID